MAGVNRVTLLGNLGKDPELRHTQNGQAVANFSVAVNEKWKNKSGELQESTFWGNVVVWGAMGENCAKYLKKGSQCYIEGKLQTREWKDKEGATRYTTEVVASNVVFLGAKSGGDRPPHPADTEGAAPQGDADGPL